MLGPLLAGTRFAAARCRRLMMYNELVAGKKLRPARNPPLNMNGR